MALLCRFLEPDSGVTQIRANSLSIDVRNSQIVRGLGVSFPRGLAHPFDPLCQIRPGAKAFKIADSQVALGWRVTQCSSFSVERERHPGIGLDAIALLIRACEVVQRFRVIPPGSFPKPDQRLRRVSFYADTAGVTVSDQILAVNVSAPCSLQQIRECSSVTPLARYAIKEVLAHL